MAPLAGAVGLVGDAGQGVVDLLHRQQGLGREGQVTLAVDGDGAALTGLLVELNVAGSRSWAR